MGHGLCWGSNPSLPLIWGPCISLQCELWLSYCFCMCVKLENHRDKQESLHLKNNEVVTESMGTCTSQADPCLSTFNQAPEYLVLSSIVPGVHRGGGVSSRVRLQAYRMQLSASNIVLGGPGHSTSKTASACQCQAQWVATCCQRRVVVMTQLSNNFPRASFPSSQSSVSQA